MEEQFLDFDYDNIEEELTEYDKKIKCIKQAYSYLNEFKDLKNKDIEINKVREQFYKELLEYKGGIFYKLYTINTFHKIDRTIYNKGLKKLFAKNKIQTEYIPYTIYIVYDGEFICKITENRIHRVARCKLPQIDKQLNYYRLTLRFEDFNI